MIRSEPIIAVENVKSSSDWYQSLLSCRSLHGGDTFEMLGDENHQVFLCLHKWGAHDHPTLSVREPSSGNGLIIYLRVENLEAIWGNAKRMNTRVEEPPHVNQNSGERQFCLRDPDGYYLMISE